MTDTMRGLTKQRSRRWGVKMMQYLGTGLIAAVVLGTLAERNRTHKSPQTFDELFDLVAMRGGMLVHCENNVCRDLKTAQVVGHGPDGLYISYPDGSVSQEELEQQSKWIQELMNKEVQQKA